LHHHLSYIHYFLYIQYLMLILHLTLKLKLILVSSKCASGLIKSSFGISRILSQSIEYGIYTRPEDDQRAVIPISPSIVPIKIAGLFQHSPTRIDKSSASIGRRYSRSDEIGIPFCITIDQASLDSDVEIKKEKNDEESGKESLSNQTVTIRERDSMDQIRVHRSIVVDFFT
ncbi:MAG: hypothetical protein EZS28_049778, partial [Streblomastix strix]